MLSFVRPTAAVWAVALLAAGFASNLFLSCGSNLIAFAVVAALTLRPRTAAAVALSIWLESEFLGYTVFGYPHETMSAAWGLALGVGTLVATFVAVLIARWLWLRTGALPAVLVAAFVAAFAMHELTLWTFANAIRNGLGEFTFGIISQLAWSNALVALGSVLLYYGVGVAQSVTARAGLRPRV